MNPPKTRPPMPDRLSTDPRSPHYVAAVLEHEIGVRFNGRERTDVAEYCISESWVRVAAGKTVDRHGNPLLIKIKGPVQAYYRADGPGSTSGEAAGADVAGGAA